jgi:hypothetical protein
MLSEGYLWPSVDERNFRSRVDTGDPQETFSRNAEKFSPVFEVSEQWMGPIEDREKGGTSPGRHRADGKEGVT